MIKASFTAMAALALVVSPLVGAQAQDFDVKPYVGVGLGAFGLEVKDTNAVFSQNETVFGGYAKVGADIGDYLGGELRIGATSSGTQSNPVGTGGSTIAFDSKLQADYFFSYLVKLQFPATQDLKLYALLGGTTAKMKFTASAAGVTGGVSGTKTGFSYGLGAEYSLQDMLSVGLEWMQYWNNVGAFVDGNAKLWGVVVTGAYHF